jgi:hypothetical protein
MKKIFLNLTATAMLGLALTACNNEEANKKAAEADTAAVQTLVEDKMKAMDEEVTKACDEAVNAAAQHVVDSLAAAKPTAKGVVKKAPVKKAPVAVKPAPVKPKGGLGEGKAGAQNNAPSKLGEGKAGAEKPAEPAKLGKGKQGVQ